MYNLLSLLIGAIIAIMVAVNGELSGSLGNYFSLIIIHLLGFLTILGIMLFKKTKYLSETARHYTFTALEQLAFLR
jgi:bacterial/archaeal transporter family-2 protein